MSGKTATPLVCALGRLGAAWSMVPPHPGAERDGAGQGEVECQENAQETNHDPQRDQVISCSSCPNPVIDPDHQWADRPRPSPRAG